MHVTCQYTYVPRSIWRTNCYIIYHSPLLYTKQQWRAIWRLWNTLLTMVLMWTALTIMGFVDFVCVYVTTARMGNWWCHLYMCHGAFKRVQRVFLCSAKTLTCVSHITVHFSIQGNQRRSWQSEPVSSSTWCQTGKKNSHLTLSYMVRLFYYIVRNYSFVSTVWNQSSWMLEEHVSKLVYTICHFTGWCYLCHDWWSWGNHLPV